MGLERKAAAGVLKEVATLLELHDENPHRVRAFANAARAVERIEGDLEQLVASGEIRDLKGIGRGTAGVLAELMQQPTPQVLAELEGRTPQGVREMLQISGLGPKKTRTLWRDLDIASPGQLEYACRENRLVELPGFGAKSQSLLLEAVRFLQSTRDRWLAHQGWEKAQRLAGEIAEHPGVERVHVAGEVRRCCETVAGLDLVVCGDAESVEHAVAGCLDQPRWEVPSTWVATTSHGFPVTVRVPRPQVEAVTLLWATGSRQHLEALRRQATAVGLRLEQGEGLWSNGELLPCPDERRLYEAVGCQWVPPELREDGSEVMLAARNEIPRLVDLDDLRGVLHNHSTDSDGAATVEEMGSAALVHGWQFLGIADHSPAAHYANGLTADRLRDQWRRIDAYNRAAEGLRIVKGLEADILADGRLDIPDGCEDGLEYVVASVHSGFRMDRKAQTDRIVAAVRHPACRVLGHPSGRLLLARPPYDVDLDRVLEECAEAAVTVEINASPYRLDLDWRWARRALDLGLTLVINPDAHAVDGLEDVRWGIGVARKAGATPEQVLNCGAIEEWIDGR
jgi:DNA polymerase (family 10)